MLTPNTQIPTHARGHDIRYLGPFTIQLYQLHDTWIVEIREGGKILSRIGFNSEREARKAFRNEIA